MSEKRCTRFLMSIQARSEALSKASYPMLKERRLFS